jgi:hypothetical protein
LNPVSLSPKKNLVSLSIVELFQAGTHMFSPFSPIPSEHPVLLLIHKLFLKFCSDVILDPLD